MIKKNALVSFQGIDKIVFFLFLIGNLLPIYFSFHVGSLDGPKHLQIANIMKEIWQGNELFKLYFEISPPYIGNVAGHYILAVLRLLLPAWISEKILLTLYVVLLATGFRYLVKGISKSINFSYLFIFCFTYTNLFMMGYYNYSLAFGFLFFSLGYYIRHKQTMRWDNILVLSFLILLTYYSHVFVYGFLLMSLGLVFLNTLFSEYREKRTFKMSLLYNRFFSLLIALLPSFILAGFYINLILQFPAIQGEVLLFDRWHNLMNLQVLVGFFNSYEIPFTQKLFWALITLVGITMAIKAFKMLRGKSETDTEKINNSDKLVWGMLLIVFFGLYLLMPNTLNAAGNVLNRIVIMAFYFLLIWLSIRRFPIVVNLSILAFIIFYTSGIYPIHTKQRQKYDTVITEIKSIENEIPDNSVFLSQNYLPGWVTYHFQTYIGTDKPILNINSQAISPLFVVRWSETMPQTYVGVNYSHTYTYFYNIPNVAGTILTEYITVVGKEGFAKEEEGNPLVEAIKLYYKEVGNVDNSLVALYKLNIGNGLEVIENDIKSDENYMKRLQEKSIKTSVPVEDLVKREAIWLYKKKSQSLDN